MEYTLQELKKKFVSGRTFGLNGRIYKGVVLERKGDTVTWTFANGLEPAQTPLQKFPGQLDSIGNIDRNYRDECRELYKSKQSQS